MSSSPIEKLKLALRMETSHALAEIVARYADAYDQREGRMLAFLDEEGALKHDADQEEFDQVCEEQWMDSYRDLGRLLEELKRY